MIPHYAATGQIFRAQETDGRLQPPTGHSLPHASIPTNYTWARLNPPVRKTTTSQPSEALTGYAALLIRSGPYFLVITQRTRVAVIKGPSSA